MVTIPEWGREVTSAERRRHNREIVLSLTSDASNRPIVKSRRLI